MGDCIVSKSRKKEDKTNCSDIFLFLSDPDKWYHLNKIQFAPAEYCLTIHISNLQKQYFGIHSKKVKFAKKN